MLEQIFKAHGEADLVFGVMCHDLFPLELPETCQEITANGYVSWFNQVVPRADFFVTNSEATRTSLKSYLDANKDLRPNVYPSGSFRLGAELDLMGSEKKSKSHEQIWGASGRVMLCVGTIEPRKNHEFLLDTFDLLRERDEDVTLIILGRTGWKNREILDRIQAHAEYDKRLFHMGNASDRDLATVFERADCLICPSIAEGFGLPVAEGLMRGLKVFASDIEVFHEIGGEKCFYFNLNSPTNLADQLSDWFALLQGGQQAKDQTPFLWPNWEESAKEFVHLTLELAEQSQKAAFDFEAPAERTISMSKSA